MKEAKYNIGFIYNNRWQIDLYEKFVSTSSQNYKLYPLEIVGYYSKNIAFNSNASAIVRHNTWFREFSILDGLFNYYDIKKQLKKWLDSSNLDVIIFDNPDRYIERILINNITINTKVLYIQHGFDPMERLFNLQNSIRSKIGILFRNIIFNHSISVNPFHSINLVRESRSIVYSEYFKKKLSLFVDYKNIHLSRDPRTINPFTNQGSQIKDSKNLDLLVFTGLFRYRNFTKYLPDFFTNLEQLGVNTIYLKPKIGEGEILRRFIANQKQLKKKYIIFDENENVMKDLTKYSRFMCSIESTVSLELLSKGINRFFLYDLPFYDKSLIRRSLIEYCTKISEGLYELDIFQIKNTISLNFYLGLNLPLLLFDDVTL